MIRAFFAIPIDATVTAKLQRETAELHQLFEDRIKWVDKAKWHVTVKFFGAIEPEVLANIAKIANEFAHNTAPFVLKIRKISAFPAPAGRNIAVHLVSQDDLHALHVCLDKAGEKMGIRRENRRYRPHITLAKYKSVPPVFEPLLYSDFELPVTEFVLYESKLLPEGSVYLPLRRFNLTKSGD